MINMRLMVQGQCQIRARSEKAAGQARATLHKRHLRPISSPLVMQGGRHLARLKTDIWVSALMRRAVSEGAFAVVAKRGDRDAGAVLLTVRTRDGLVRLYQAATNMDGERVWHEGEAQPARDIDVIIAKQSRRDMDLWVVEIDDREGRHFLTEPVVSALKT